MGFSMEITIGIIIAITILYLYLDNKDNKGDK